MVAVTAANVADIAATRIGLNRALLTRNGVDVDALIISLDDAEGPHNAKATAVIDAGNRIGDAGFRASGSYRDRNVLHVTVTDGENPDYRALEDLGTELALMAWDVIYGRPVEFTR